MRAIVCTSAVVITLAGWFGSAPLAAEPQRILWYRDYDFALTEASFLRRPILVHVTSKWSPACLRLERSTFVDPKFVAFLNSNFLAVRVDVDDSPELATRLHAESLPVAIVLSTDGRELARIDGFHSVDSYIAVVNAAIGRPQSDVDRRAANPVVVGRSAGNPTVRYRATVTGVRVATREERESRADIRLASHSNEDPRELSRTLGSEPLKTAEPASVPATERVAMMDGCCPVSMLDTKKLVLGEPQFQLDCDGQRIRFSGPEQLEKFRADPARYLPVLGGQCVVSYVDDGRSTPGLARFGAVYRNRLYLFASTDERGKFQADPKRYADCDLELEGACPVCRAAGQFVPGNREFQHVFQRRLYRFDTDDHRRRFATSLDPNRAAE